MAVDRYLHVANGSGQTIAYYKWQWTDNYILQMAVNRQLHNQL